MVTSAVNLQTLIVHYCTEQEATIGAHSEPAESSPRPQTVFP